MGGFACGCVRLACGSSLTCRLPGRERLPAAGAWPAPGPARLGSWAAGATNDGLRLKLKRNELTQPNRHH